jgi:hypothetical protein
MEDFRQQKIKFSVLEHYSELAEKCLKVLENNPETISDEKIKQYINNDVIRRILVARDYDADRALEMWTKWFVIIRFYHIGMEA